VPKIFFLSPSFRLGGAEQQLAYLAQGLISKKYAVVVASFDDGVWNKQFNTIGIKTYILTQKSFLGRIFILLNLIAKEKPDLVHCYGSTAGIYGCLCSLLLGVKRIVSERSDPRTKSRLRLLIELPINYLSNSIITNSEHAKRYYIAWRIAPSKKVHYIANGIEASSFIFKERTFPINETRPLKIGYIANFLFIKQHFLIPRIIKELLKSNLNFEFHLLGSGPEREKLENELSNLGLSSYVKIYSKNLKASEFLDSIDIYIHLSKIEGCPNAILEALLSGVPALVMPSQGAKEVVKDSGNGIVTATFSESEISLAIKSVANGESSSKLSSENGRKFIMDTYQIDRMIESTIEVYRDVAEISE